MWFYDSILRHGLYVMEWQDGRREAVVTNQSISLKGIKKIKGLQSELPITHTKFK